MNFSVIGFWGGYPAPDGSTSAYLIEKDGFKLLIDLGSGALSKLQKKMNTTDIDTVILSHYHADHVADIGVLQYSLLVQSFLKENVDVLPIYGHTEDMAAFNSLNHQYTKALAYNPNAPLQVGPFQIEFLKTVHPVPCYGMRITDGESTLVYTADSSFMEEWIDFSKGADLLLVDCNFYANQDGTDAGHMNSTDVAYIAKKADVGELILSHLPQYGDRAELINEVGKRFGGKIRLAHEKLTWEK